MATAAIARRAPRRVKVRQPISKAEGMEPARVQMAKAISDILDEQKLTQTEAGYIMRDAPSQISLVVTGKLRGFSSERLLRMLARLGRDIEIVAKPARGKQGRIRFTQT